MRYRGLWRRSLLVGLAVATFCATCRCLDNGLALTPPMGWLSWERFRCNTDCDNDPDNCISERLYMEMADILATQGYREAGYVYVDVDDCWPAPSRDPNGNLVPDPKRFPSGMKALADYVHSKGLKFGIYEDFGTLTCNKFPGSEFYLKQDADLFAQWEVDSVKFDGCHSNVLDFDYGYPAMSFYLNQTGRHMLYVCEWPYYQWLRNTPSNYTAIRQACNTWRNFLDVQDSWASVSAIIDHYKNSSAYFAQFAGPGGWFDPDMLVVGDFGLSYEQERAQMAFWAVLAAPLMMSVDLRNIRNSSKALLLNPRIIAVNQDPLGIMGTYLTTITISPKYGAVDIWTRPISPQGSLAVLFYYNSDHGMLGKIKVKASDLGLTASQGYRVQEVFDGVDVGAVMPGDVMNVTVPPSGGVYFIKAVPQTY